MSIDKYLKFKRAVDKTLEKYCQDLFEEKKYKRVDELLYLWFTWEKDKKYKGKSLKKLFGDLGLDDCIKLFDKFIKTLQEKIEES